MLSFRIRAASAPVGSLQVQASNTGEGKSSSCKVAERPGEAWRLLVHWLVVSLVSNSYWALMGLAAHGAYGMMRGLQSREKGQEAAPVREASSEGRVRPTPQGPPLGCLLVSKTKLNRHSTNVSLLQKALCLMR